MTKTYCDLCGAEITNKNLFINSLRANRVRGKMHKRIKIVADIVLIEPTDLDFCKYCIIDVIKTLDDRPKEPQNA